MSRLFAAADDAPLTLLQMTLVNCRIGADRERLKYARPCWTVARDEYYAGHSFTSSGQCGTASSWKLQASDQFHWPNGISWPSAIMAVIYCPASSQRSASPSGYPPGPSVASGFHVLSKVTIDILHQLPQGLPAQEGWEITRRNGRVWIKERGSRIVRLDAAHYSMLLATCCGQEALEAPATQFLVRQQLSASCRADRQLALLTTQ